MSRATAVILLASVLALVAAYALGGWPPQTGDPQHQFNRLMAEDSH